MPKPDQMPYDVAIVGGGPAGLSAALTLGRARKRVLLLDGGEPRNARAQSLHNFVTRDGIPPSEFRRLAHDQLVPYTSVERRDRLVAGIDGDVDAFTLRLEGGGEVEARRVLLALGMVDEPLALPGFRELWGRAIFQCPYCHGWEARDRPFGYLAPGPEWLEWAMLLQAWTDDVVVFTDGRFEVPAPVRSRLAAAGVGLEERPLGRLVGAGDRLEAVVLADGTSVPREVLFARPPQHQTALIQGLGLTLDAHGFVQLDDHRQTSRRGIFAAGDLTTGMQGAVIAAAAGMTAAGMLNHQLTVPAPPAAAAA